MSPIILGCETTASLAGCQSGFFQSQQQTEKKTKQVIITVFLTKSVWQHAAKHARVHTQLSTRVVLELKAGWLTCQAVNPVSELERERRERERECVWSRLELCLKLGWQHSLYAEVQTALVIFYCFRDLNTISVCAKSVLNRQSQLHGITVPPADKNLTTDCSLAVVCHTHSTAHVRQAHKPQSMFCSPKESR